MAAFSDPTQHCCLRLCIALITVSQTHSLALLTTGRGKDESLVVVTLNFRNSEEDFVGSVLLMAVKMTQQEV